MAMPRPMVAGVETQLEKMMDQDPHYTNAEHEGLFEWSLQGKTFI
jgi:hypothetical protein